MPGNYGFIARSWSNGRAFTAHRAAGKRRNMARFAQALADSATGSLSEAARAAGISQQTGSIYFREICGALGWQCLTSCECEQCLGRRAA